MDVVRRFVGLFLLVISAALGEVCHAMIHFSAWLLDREEDMKECMTCRERD